MSNKKQQNKALQNKIEQQNEYLQKLHLKLFPEEYDFMYDSHSEKLDRKRGINPMSEEYQRKVNLRRYKLGVEPYDGSIGISNTTGLISSWDYCKHNLSTSSESDT